MLAADKKIQRLGGAGRVTWRRGSHACPLDAGPVASPRAIFRARLQPPWLVCSWLWILERLLVCSSLEDL